VEVVAEGIAVDVVAGLVTVVEDVGSGADCREVGVVPAASDGPQSEKAATPTRTPPSRMTK
jgi:hypothetical protein